MLHKSENFKVAVQFECIEAVKAKALDIFDLAPRLHSNASVRLVSL
jgi:hypothetical protein